MLFQNVGHGLGKASVREQARRARRAPWDASSSSDSDPQSDEDDDELALVGRLHDPLIINSPEALTFDEALAVR